MKLFFALIMSALLLLIIGPLGGQEMETNTIPGLGVYDQPFLEGGSYNDDSISPKEFFGFQIGSRPLKHDEIFEYFSTLSKHYPNATLHLYGKTYEGRELIYLVISNENNSGNLDEIRRVNGLLADPRNLSRNSEAANIIKNNPAIAWMSYSIHGDELSSSDAAVWLAYQLLAGTDPISRKIMDQTIVIIDPLQNPDGRERFLAQMQQWNSVIPSSDNQSFHHTGQWPWGRGNHYLFDLNRDWVPTVHPETRGRVNAILEWQPQLLVDAHEMGPFDTYLFNPPRAPFNPYLPKSTMKWWKIFGNDQATAFDQFGWSYYTRDWNEELYPGYGSSWGIYTGLVGILYEQSETSGSIMKRLDGTIQTFREAVHHQFVSSFANLTTLADNREEILTDYYNHRNAAVSKSGSSQAYIFPPANNRTRQENFVAALERQNIEIYESTRSFTLPAAVSTARKTISKLKIPAGSVIIPVNQPLKALVQNLLSFEIRIDTKSLEKERHELLKNNNSTIYDITAWSLPLAYGIDGYYTDTMPKTNLISYQSKSRDGSLVNPHSGYGYVMDAADDRFYPALSELFEQGMKVWAAKKSFQIESHSFSQGSILIKKNSNPQLQVTGLAELARRHGIDIIGINTALAESGPDLGGSDFILLDKPRIAILGGSPVSTYSFGSSWHLFDTRMKSRISLVSLADVTDQDLSKYNVLIFPSTWGETNTIKKYLGDAGVTKLKDWINAGGSLIAIGNSAAFLADTSFAVSNVRLKRQSLEKLNEYAQALKEAKATEHIELDSLKLWEGSPEATPAPKSTPATKSLETLQAEDEKGRTLRPQGAILKVNLDSTHWLNFGAGDDISVLYNTGSVFMAKKPVQTPARLGERGNVRLSGLLWPEAENRLAETPWATREAIGRGQIILFATQPNFRGYFHDSERLLLNSVFFGPGMGTARSVEW